MKFFASAIIAFSLIFQLAAARCADCSAKGMGGSTVCVTQQNVGCGFCCSELAECIDARNKGRCKHN
ncbi:hypothetical protein Vi05172_g7980 [Venturia inaequalis]|nr:hypothetical protein Vi05172_g7980 [Venturia inaequalis]